jgi:cyclopropane fatty-acyl-phospholipid synthase-like methyltransferase
MYKKLLMRKKCYKCLYHHRSDENIQNYKNSRRNTKKPMNEAKGQAYVEMYRKLDMKEGKMISIE